MTKLHDEIDDDEIRIISSVGQSTGERKRRNKILRLWLPVIIAVLLIAILPALLLRCDDDDDEVEPVPVVTEVIETEPTDEEESEVKIKGYTAVVDTMVNSTKLLVLTPENAVPSLAIGDAQLADSTIVLVTQAADVRGDNGTIAGAFVLDGELVSRGEAKAGYCAIINGELTIGVADATPMLEQALTEDGYFFRQYPLVVGGQIVENKPKGKAVRKALAELNGRICVVMSKSRLTFHDFSQALVALGVRNAIYLVGSVSSGFYVTESGERFMTGIEHHGKYENINYILWK